MLASFFYFDKEVAKMLFQVAYKTDGMNFSSPVMDEKQKDQFVAILTNSGIEYQVLSRADKLWHCAHVVFDLNIIPEAREAIKNGKDIRGIYKYGDPNEIAKKGSVVQVECTDGQRKAAYVVDIILMTEKQIKEFKSSIGYTKMGLVKGII